MTNWTNPQLTSTYTNFVTEVKDRDTDLAVQFDGVTVTNIPTNTIRWDSTANRWKKWSGSAWGELAATYALTALTTTGTATFGGNVGVTGTVDASSTVTGTAFIPDGSSAPSNGIYLPSANTLGLATASTGRLFVDSNGNLGIGDSSPGAKLDVVGGVKAAAGSTFNGDMGYTFRSGGDEDGGMFSPADNEICFATNNSRRLTIKGDKVGIGVASPSTALHINDSGASAVELRLQNSEGVGKVINDGDKLTYAADGHVFQSESGSALGAWTTAARLGVNTTSPTETLDVNGTAKATAFSGPLTGNVTGNLTGNVTGNVTGSAGTVTGNAGTATKLVTARTIGGVSFDGSANINLPGVNTTGSQNTTGSSASCTGNSATATDLSINASNVLVYQVANNNSSTLASGSSGQVLQSNGSSAPSWTDITGIRGYIAFNGTNSSVYRSSNLSLGKTGTGLYTITIASGAQTGNSNYGVVITNISDKRWTSTAANNTIDQHQSQEWNIWLESRSTSAFYLRSRAFDGAQRYRDGGNDEWYETCFNRSANDPDYVAVILF